MIEFFLLFYSINPIWYVVWALAAHWVADFVMQEDEEAQGKSSDIRLLNLHIFKYTLTMLMLTGPVVALVNAFLHWVTDYFSSRVCKRLWLKGDRHNFFVVIGLDQLLHTVPLVLTAYHFQQIFQTLGVTP